MNHGLLPDSRVIIIHDFARLLDFARTVKGAIVS